MQLTDNISLKEMVYPTMYRNYGNSAKWFLDERVPKIVQAIRDELSRKLQQDISIRLNTWPWKGNLTQKGLRPFNTKTGSKLSQHKFGRAADPEFIIRATKKEIPPDEIREMILKNSIHYMAMGLTTLEDGAYAPGWVHLDVRWTGLNRILIIKP